MFTVPQRTWESLEQGTGTGSQLQFQHQFKYPSIFDMTELHSLKYKWKSLSLFKF